MQTPAKATLAVIFTTVFLDLVGFGIVIPLVAIYGNHFSASGLQLAILGSIYSLMQFFFAPIWGAWSDRIGRRPILLVSLAGSTASYFLFAWANDIQWLILSRALGGIFAANISTAQAYIADITKPEDRAKGMGLIGAAFGIGFTLGPPIGGIAGSKWGLWAPGIIAGTISGLNLVLAAFRLKESLPEENRAQQGSAITGLGRRFQSLAEIKNYKGQDLIWPLLSFFVITFAFSNLEQVFSLLIQSRFELDTTRAAFQTGMILMWSGILGALIQGGLIRRIIPKFGEVRIAKWGFFIQAFAMILFSFAPSYESFFLFAVPLAFGSGLLNPSLNSMISRLTPPDRQGATMGLNQALGSLARIAGPFVGISLFQINPHFPFVFAGIVVLATGLFWLKKNIHL